MEAKANHHRKWEMLDDGSTFTNAMCRPSNCTLVFVRTENWWRAAHMIMFTFHVTSNAICALEDYSAVAVLLTDLANALFGIRVSSISRSNLWVAWNLRTTTSCSKGACLLVALTTNLGRILKKDLFNWFLLWWLASILVQLSRGPVWPWK